MNYFETRVKWDKVVDCGDVKPVTETYTVNADSFTEAEARITEQLTPEIHGAFEVVAEAKAKYHDVVYHDGDLFFEVKYVITMVSPDLKKEKKIANYALFRVKDIDAAKIAASAFMVECLYDYEIQYIKQTKIVDVFEREERKEEES